MKSAKEYYRNYQADDDWSELSSRMVEEVYKHDPIHVLEFGSGSGKHLGEMGVNGISSCGLDISITNLLNSHFKNNNQFLILGDESHLRHLCNFDICITVSVLDHIEDVTDIVDEFKRICNKAVILAEATRHDPETYYWNHDYKAMGFTKLDYSYTGEDGATYYIWKWDKQ